MATATKSDVETLGTTLGGQIETLGTILGDKIDTLLVAFKQNSERTGEYGSYLDDNACPICLDKLGWTRNTVKSTCFHHLHEECWERMSNKRVCPMCRSNDIKWFDITRKYTGDYGGKAFHFDHLDDRGQGLRE